MQGRTDTRHVPSSRPWEERKPLESLTSKVHKASLATSHLVDQGNQGLNWLLPRINSTGRCKLGRLGSWVCVQLPYGVTASLLSQDILDLLASEMDLVKCLP